MFNSLRSRLWLSYALLIAVVLCVVGAAVAVILFRSNIPLQQAALKLQSLRANALPRLQTAKDLDPRILQALLDRNIDPERGRIAILLKNGDVVADSMGLQATSLPDFDAAPLQTEVGALPSFYLDSQRNGWYYIIDEVSPDRLAFFAVNRPRLQVLAIFRDQFFGPLIRGGLIALLVSTLLALILSRWISKPLQQISQEAGRVAEGQAHPIPPQGPAEVRTLALAFNDMTHQVQTSRQSQKDFIANVSHELKTPLTSIQGFARAILDGMVSNREELQQAAEVIESEAGRMDRLVTDLLTLARMDAGTAAFKMRDFDAQTLLDAAVKKFSPLIDRAGLQLEVSFMPGPTMINGDPDRLMQVLDNLLANAIKFTPEGGRVSLVSEKYDGNVEIQVGDTGPGIPPEEQERIFERFYQVDKARSGGVSRGYGLGLAISKQIVEAHGGALCVTSGSGEGSHFVVKLPLQS